MPTGGKKSSRTKLTQKQESFVLNYFASGNATQSAISAGYSPKTAIFIASETLRKPYVQARLQALRSKVESAKIADVVERKERLSQYVRANITDYMDTEGNISLEKNPGAVAELVIEDWQGGEEGRAHRTKRIKLHSPLQAIDILNKMEKIYSDTPAGGYQDNRVINIIVGSTEAKQALEAVNKRLLTSGEQNP